MNEKQKETQTYSRQATRSSLADRQSIHHQLLDAQRRLQREVSLYEHRCEWAPIGLLILDRRGRVIEWNRRAATILDNDSPRDRPLSAFLSQDSADELHRVMNRSDWSKLERTLARGDGQPLVAVFKRSTIGDQAVVVMSITD